MNWHCCLFVGDISPVAVAIKTGVYFGITVLWLKQFGDYVTVMHSSGNEVAEKH